MADFRSYDPQLGRWHQIDPIDKEDLSPYAWVTNNPLLYSDPFGLDSLNSQTKGFSWDNVKPGDFVDGTQVLDEVVVTPDKNDVSYLYPKEGDQVYEPREGLLGFVEDFGNSRVYNGFQIGRDGKATGQMAPVTGAPPILPTGIGSNSLSLLQLLRTGLKAARWSTTILKFTGDEAVQHFSSHAGQIMKVTGKTLYNLKNYIDDANWIIQNGTYSSKLNGYYHYMGNSAKGESLFGFVGLKNAGSNISTFHIKTATQLGLK
jgi:hypothetical protein